jgi:hypothetical protein
MKTKSNRNQLLHQIRVGHAALLKQRRGIKLLENEVRTLEYLEPVDVTHALLKEIDRLNNEIVNLIYKYSTLEAELKEEAHLDI